MAVKQQLNEVCLLSGYRCSHACEQDAIPLTMGWSLCVYLLCSPLIVARKTSCSKCALVLLCPDIGYPLLNVVECA